MDWEAPLDGWYVFIALSIVTVALTGLVLAMPREPPPDANRAANAIDGVSAASYEAHETIRHDATEVKVTRRTVELRNERGKSAQSFAFGEVILANQHEDLEAVAWGADLEEHYPAFEDEWGSGNGTEQFIEEVEAHRADAHGNWTTAYGELTVRRLAWRADDIPWESTASNCGYWSWGCSLLSSGNNWQSPEEQRRELANDHSWLEYDSTHDRFYVTLVVL